MTALAGKTVVDVSLVVETDEIVYMTHDGTEPRAAPNPYVITVFLATVADPTSVVEIASAEMDVAPISIAYWRGSLFLGDDAGVVHGAPGQATE